jgi:release factor glutamine methyltransferase
VSEDGVRTVLDVLRLGTDWLRGRGVENPRLDAEVLVAHALGWKRLDLYLRFDRPLADAERDRIRELIRRRGARVPVAYLVGERDFHALAFHVDERVLVPRPETEHLVDAGIGALADLPEPVFADVGTGSGCIAVSVLHALPRARAHALDRSEGALAVAARNAERHGVTARLAFHAGDLLEPLAGHPDFGRLDAVLSNPPYVVRGDPAIDPDVLASEPPEALYVPGDDPLEVARRVAARARDALRPGGLLAIEIGAGSGPAGRTMLESLGYADVALIPDLARIDRVVTGRRAT